MLEQVLSVLGVLLGVALTVYILYEYASLEKWLKKRDKEEKEEEERIKNGGRLI